MKKYRFSDGTIVEASCKEDAIKQHKVTADSYSKETVVKNIYKALKGNGFQLYIESDADEVPDYVHCTKLINNVGTLEFNVYVNIKKNKSLVIEIDVESFDFPGNDFNYTKKFTTEKDAVKYVLNAYANGGKCADGIKKALNTFKSSLK